MDEQIEQAVGRLLNRHTEIDYLLIADRAEVVNGKLYLMGGSFDRLPGSAPTSAFADRRTYLFDGREVDHCACRSDEDDGQHAEDYEEGAAVVGLESREEFEKLTHESADSPPIASPQSAGKY